MENETTIPKDIDFPDQLQDGCFLTLNHKEYELTAYLFKEGNCPISSLIQKKIEPTKDNPSEIERCFNIFLTIYKSRSQYFNEKPNFTILYSSRCLQNKAMVSMTSNFIKDYINDLESVPDERMLDYLIPFTILRENIQDKPPVIVPFMLFLCEKYGVNIFFKHFLPVLELMTNYEDNQDCEIQNFHIELLTAIIESFDLDQYEVDDIEAKILIPLQYDETISIKLACAALGKVIDSTPSRRDSASNSPLREQTQIPIKELNYDKLNSYLDEVDSKSYISPAIVLGNIKTQIELVNNWPPNRPFAPVFQLSMSSYRKSNEINRANIFFIISFINHTFYNKLEDMLKLYIDTAHDPDSNVKFADKCYQEFLNLVYSDRDLAEQSSELLENAPLNLLDNPPQKIKSTHNSLMVAANSLKDWNTAYDGVLRIWREITKNPDVILYPYIKDLEFSKISYLYQGLKEIIVNCEPILGVDHALRRMENYVNSFEIKKETPTKKKYRKSPLTVKNKSNPTALSPMTKFSAFRTPQKNIQ